jgi:alpha-L-rhamnosidase
MAFAPNGDGTQLLDYSMLWAQSLQDYLELTGDHTFAARLYPKLQVLLAHLDSRRNRTTGLLDVAPGHWSQTSVIDWAGPYSRFGQSTALNALYYGTLLDAADVARRLGDPRRAALWRQTAEALKQQINRHLYQVDPGEYVSSIVNGQLITPTTHAQGWPLAFEVTPAVNVTAVVTSLLKSVAVEIFGMYWVLEGLSNAGRIDEAVQLVEERYGRLLDLGATTLWEHWDSNERYRAALSHSWGGAPTWFLTTRVLGASRRGPDRWVVQPAFAGVEWATGAIPLGKGELQLTWQRPSCAGRILEVHAPAGSTGEIVVHSEDVVDIHLNGQLVWRGGQSLSADVRLNAGLIRIRAAGGASTLQATVQCHH